jgi:hypothetical protein
MIAPAPKAFAGDLLDEVWVGGFSHDISDIGAGKESGDVDVEIEADSVRPRLLRPLGAPRITAVMMLDSAGVSSFAALGLTWNHTLFFPRLRASADFGVGVSDGLTTAPAGAAGERLRAHRLLLGSDVLFREALGLDWRLSRHWSIGLEFTHDSNGHILASGYNEGITDLGLRLGYAFR